MGLSRKVLPVLALALDIAREALPKYSQPKSPHKFTQPQLFACLVLKTVGHLTYRGVAELLADSAEIRRLLGLRRLPHYSTLARAADRLATYPVTALLLTRVVREAKRRGLLGDPVDRAAIDGTCFESSHASTYFVRRVEGSKEPPRRLKSKTYPTLGVVCDCKSHLILSALPGTGPWPEHWTLPHLVRQAVRRVPIRRLLADKGYDSEENHRIAREKLGIKQTIFAVNQHRGPPRGRYRREVYLRPRRKLYGQRWQVETVFSMLKRRLGSVVDARSDRRRGRELLLRVLVYDLMLVRLT
jgi:hypothetical protein